MVAATIERGRGPTTRGLPRDVVLAAAVVLGLATFALTLSLNTNYPLISILLGVIVGAFVLTLDTAVWAVVPLLVVELSIKYYQLTTDPAAAASSPSPSSSAAATAAKAVATGVSAANAAADPSSVGGLTLRIAVVLVASLLSLMWLWRNGFDLLRLRAGVRVLVPAIALIAIALSFDLPREPSDLVLRYGRYQLTQVAALVLVACLVRQPRHVRLVLRVGLALVVVSGVLAIWQYVDPINAPVAGPATTGIGSADQPAGAESVIRAVGLSGSPIQLAGAASVAVPMLFGFLLSGGVRSARVNWGLWLMAGVLCLATYLTYTRAAMLAIGSSLLVIALFLPLVPRVIMWVSLGCAAVLYLTLEGSGLIGDRYYATSSNDSSTAAHVALLEVGTQIALDNALTGIGHAHFQDVAVGYAGILSGNTQAGGTGAGALGTDPPHDDFLLVWISWGLPGLAAYLAVFGGAAMNCVVAARGQNRFVRSWAVSVLAGLAGYAVSSAFHNYLDSSMLLWLLAGLSIPLACLASQGARAHRIARPVQVSTLTLRERLVVRRSAGA